MGRKKINIKKIEDERKKAVTFSRRRIGIFKKANELSILCSCKSAVLIFDDRNNCYLYSSHDAKEMFEKFLCKDFKKLQHRKKIVFSKADDTTSSGGAGGYSSEELEVDESFSQANTAEDGDVPLISRSPSFQKYQFILPAPLKTLDTTLYSPVPSPILKDSIVTPVSLEESELKFPSSPVIDSEWGISVDEEFNPDIFLNSNF